MSKITDLRIEDWRNNWPRAMERYLILVDELTEAARETNSESRRLAAELLELPKRISEVKQQINDQHVKCANELESIGRQNVADYKVATDEFCAFIASAIVQTLGKVDERLTRLEETSAMINDFVELANMSMANAKSASNRARTDIVKLEKLKAWTESHGFFLRIFLKWKSETN